MAEEAKKFPLTYRIRIFPSTPTELVVPWEKILTYEEKFTSRFSRILSMKLTVHLNCRQSFYYKNGLP